MAMHIRAEKLPTPEREWRFHPTRMWRFDFAWPGRKLALEVEGAVHANGRHTRGAGYVKDLEKYNAAVMCGWKVLRFATEQVRSGEAVAMLREALA